MPPDQEDPRGGGWRRARALIRPGRFTGAVAWTLALRVLGLPAQLLLFILVARLHDVASVGLFGVVSSLWLATRMFGPFGFDRAAMRLLPLYAAEGRDWAASALVRYALARLAVPALLCGGALVAAALWLEQVLPVLSGAGQESGAAVAMDERGIVLICGLGLPAYVLIGFLVGVVRARRKVIAAQLPELVGQPLLSLLLIGAVALLRPDSGVEGSLAAVAASAWTVALVYCWSIRDLLRRGPALPGAERRTIMSASVGIGLATVVTMVTQRGPLFIVAALAGASAAGLYESAHRLALLGTIGTWATGAAVAPMVAAAHAGRDGGRLRQLVAGSILVSSAQALGVVFLLLLFGDWLLGLFGPAFVAAHATAVFLALAYLLNAIGGPVASACYMIGRERLVLAFNLAAAVTMAVAVTVGALTLGATGAALGFLLALMVGDGGMAIAARTVLGIGLRDLHPGRLALALAPPAEGGPPGAAAGRDA